MLENPRPITKTRLYTVDPRKTPGRDDSSRVGGRRLKLILDLLPLSNLVYPLVLPLLYPLVQCVLWGWGVTSVGYQDSILQKLETFRQFPVFVTYTDRPEVLVHPVTPFNI